MKRTIRMEPDDGAPALTLGLVEQFCADVRAAGAEHDTPIRGRVTWWRGLQRELAAVIEGGTAPAEEPMQVKAPGGGTGRAPR